jgi:hypothetical protein
MVLKAENKSVNANICDIENDSGIENDRGIEISHTIEETFAVLGKIIAHNKDVQVYAIVPTGSSDDRALTELKYTNLSRNYALIKAIKTILIEMGLLIGYRGYYMITDAIMLKLNDTTHKFFALERLYVALSEAYGVTTDSIRGSMNRTIKSAWESGQLARYCEKSGLSFNVSNHWHESVVYKNKRPTLKAFLDTIVDHFNSNESGLLK